MLFKLHTTDEVKKKLAKAFWRNRKAMGHSRVRAADDTGVPMSTIRRFERTGEISLRQFLMLCEVYGDMETSKDLFPEPQPSTMDELLEKSKT